MEQPSTVTESTTSATPAATSWTTSAAPAPVSETTSVKAPVSGDATEKAPEETFTTIDTKSLTPAEKAKYDLMLSDYKKKTSEIASQRREYEAALEKAKLADMLTSDPEVVNFWNQKYQQQQQAEVQREQQAAQDPMMVKKEVDVLKANLLVKDFKAAHPDFDELDSDSLITGYVQLNPPKSEREWSKTLEKAYDYAKTLREKWRGEGKKEGLTRVSEKASGSTLPPSNTAAPSYSGDKSKLTVAEAVELARKGIRIN